MNKQVILAVILSLSVGLTVFGSAGFHYYNEEKTEKEDAQGKLAVVSGQKYDVDVKLAKTEKELKTAEQKLKATKKEYESNLKEISEQVTEIKKDYDDVLEVKVAENKKLTEQLAQEKIRKKQ